MSDKQVYSVVDGPIMKIIIDNPEMKNGTNYIGTNQFADCLEELNANPNIKVGIITGNDEYFWTGGRVDPNNPGEQEKYSAGIARFEKVRSENKVPLIAAVNGDCLKAGMGMIADCDFAIARKGVIFGFPEVRMGGVPMMVMQNTIFTMPKKRALEAYLTSWNFSAEDAYMMGLVNKVVEKADFWPTVDKYARIFLDTPPIIVEMTRRAFSEMYKIKDDKVRAEFAMNMLRDEVLPAMTKVKTQYNI